MYPTGEVRREHHPNRTLAAGVRALAGMVALMIATAVSALGYTTSSGASVGSNGTIYGWGVTDVYGGGMVHTAYVSTRLRSPRGRTASSGWRSQYDIVRADVYLSWDSTDLGTYFTTSDHQYYCALALVFFWLGGSEGSTPVPYVYLSLRTGARVSGDNSGLNRYLYWEGRDTLGTFFFSGVLPDRADWGWRTGVEIVGTVFPGSYTGTITIKRKILGGKLYRYNGPSPYLTYSPRDDSTEYSDRGLLDTDPQSGGSGGRVYDLDAPWIGSSESDFDGVVWRKRVNYQQWAVTNVGLSTITVSNYLNWYMRVSIKKTGLTDSLETTVSGDNVASVGTTPVTWDLR